jgi:hypothetical protein
MNIHISNGRIPMLCAKTGCVNCDEGVPGSGFRGSWFWVQGSKVGGIKI